MGAELQSSKRLWRIAALAARFFLGQGAVQGIGILTSFYLLRALSVDSYAQFGFATSFQQLASLLMDLGFASTIVPLVGAQRDDRELVGRYVRSAKRLRDRVFWVLSPFALIVFIAIMRRHHWDLKTQVLLAVAIFVSIYFTGKVSYFSVPLVLHGRMSEMYLPQVSVGLVRLLGLALLRAAGVLNGWVTALTGAVTILFSGSLLEKRGRHYLVWPELDDPLVDQEVLRYILPAIPAMIFAAFQVQSAVFLISIFGQSAGIAQVSALGRLNQAFAILTIFNAVIVEPFMARLRPEQVLSRYLGVLGLACLACAPIVSVAFLAPHTVLWLLGSKYRGLEAVVGWAVLAGALNYIQVLLWIMNRSRKWVFWRGTALEIGLSLAVEALYLSLHGVRTTADAISFSLVCTAGPLVTHAYITWFGLRRSAPA